MGFKPCPFQVEVFGGTMANRSKQHRPAIKRFLEGSYEASSLVTPAQLRMLLTHIGLEHGSDAAETFVELVALKSDLSYGSLMDDLTNIGSSGFDIHPQHITGSSDGTTSTDPETEKVRLEFLVSIGAITAPLDLELEFNLL